MREGRRTTACLSHTEMSHLFKKPNILSCAYLFFDRGRQRQHQLSKASVAAPAVKRRTLNISQNYSEGHILLYMYYFILSRPRAVVL